jgi:hypothetical protein
MIMQLWSHGMSEMQYRSSRVSAKQMLSTYIKMYHLILGHVGGKWFYVTSTSGKPEKVPRFASAAKKTKRQRKVCNGSVTDAGTQAGRDAGRQADENRVWNL